jgi:tetrahydromethanopterin S-methyltransferase subunit A
MNTDAIKEDIRQFKALKDNIDLLTTRQSDIKKRLMSSIDEFGTTDEKGHIILSVDDEEQIMKQKRVSKTLDLSAAEIILTKKGIRETCIKMVPTLDEAAIMAAFYNGHLTEEEIDTMFPAKATYAFIVGKGNGRN